MQAHPKEVQAPLTVNSSFLLPPLNGLTFNTRLQEPTQSDSVFLRVYLLVYVYVHVCYIGDCQILWSWSYRQL